MNANSSWIGVTTDHIPDHRCFNRAGRNSKYEFLWNLNAVTPTHFDVTAAVIQLTVSELSCAFIHVGGISLLLK